MLQPPKRSDSIVVQELLAFVQQKLDVMDQVSLEQILVSNFTEDKILEAKKVLAETAATTNRLITRQRDGRGKKDLQDIFRVFLETDPDDVPTYVVRDLNKLPPVTFDHVDVTRLLKDIVLLRTDMTNLQTKLDSSEKTVAELRNEVNELRNSKFSAPAISPASARNVSVQRGVTRCQVSPTTATPDPVLQVNDRPAAMTSVSRTSIPQPATIAPPPASRPRQQKKSYAQASRQTQPSLPALYVESQRKSLAKSKVNVPDRSKVDADGFTLVEKRRRPRSARNKRGTAAIPAESATLHAVEPTIKIYLSRFDETTTGEDVVHYIKERTQGRCQGSVRMSLQRLESSRNTGFKSYTLQIQAKHKDVLMDPNFWPAGIVYRRFREAAPKRNPSP